MVVCEQACNNARSIMTKHNSFVPKDLPHRICNIWYSWNNLENISLLLVRITRNVDLFLNQEIGYFHNLSQFYLCIRDTHYNAYYFLVCCCTRWWIVQIYFISFVSIFKIHPLGLRQKEKLQRTHVCCWPYALLYLKYHNSSSKRVQVTHNWVPNKNCSITPPKTYFLAI